jgi:hypothetical protein
MHMPQEGEDETEKLPGLHCKQTLAVVAAVTPE